VRATTARLLMPTDDNAALLRACRAGDHEAWETLVRRYQRLIYAIPRRAGLDEDQAAEVFQRVCIALFKSLDRIDQADRLGAWLATTARRESWRLLRQLRSDSSLNDGDDDGPILQIADSALLPDELIEQAERQHTVRRAVGELEERCQRILRLLFYYADEPPPYTEVAATLGIPEGSIGPTRARCLRKLQQILDDLDG
jgi:RNA polymerase sigma factor (sigma-70 family)